MVVGIINGKLDKQQVYTLEHLISNYFRANDISNLVNFQQEKKKVIFNFKNELMEDQKIAIFRIVQREGFVIEFIGEKEVA